MKSVLRERGTSCSRPDTDDPIVRGQPWQWFSNKLMTNKYPSSAVVMELACYLKRMGIKAVVDWAPRSTNYEANELANGNTCRFDPAKRIVFKASEVWS